MKVGSKGMGMEEDVFLCTSLEFEEPNSFQEVIYSLNPKGWTYVMIAEMDSMERKRLILHPKASLSKTRVFKIRHQADGLVDKFRPGHS